MNWFLEWLYRRGKKPLPQSPAPHLVIRLDPNRPSGTRTPTPNPITTTPKEAHPMISFNFNNLPHALATFFKAAAADVKKAIPVIENAIEKAEGDKAIIEGVSGAVANAVQPGAAGPVVTIEDAGFAVLGSIDAALKSGDAAAEQKLLDAGIDVNAINAVKAVGTQSQTFYKIVTSVPKAIPPVGTLASSIATK
jgi:hypothetical protein